YDITTQTEMLKRHVGYMTQHFSLYTDLSIRQNLEFVARVHELPHPRRQARAAIERLGLAGREDQLAGALSGGWKQRLALSACILPGPELLLLDEPTAGVDPKARRDFWNNIHDLAAEGMTVLVSTHYMDEAERCHELAYLSAGQILTRGTAQEVIENSHLTTWTVSGPDLSELAKRIKTLPGIESVTPFGTTLHVSGTDAARIEKSISGLLDGPQKWERAEVTLEDVFIHMMGVAGDGEA
ncbi:ABC transporter ATP-binding protein, partial [bacterium]|nr:ABC transporter ATP-binding protein [bacterium]